ncbi:hypothetical protein Are01nite_60960 [Actinoplanes regularis]|nr:hypothetical protein [Actinoplanes regularis]GIE89616.1 hypothetical protein Are01nite_60960 [Actinoplanes regularis]
MHLHSWGNFLKLRRLLLTTTITLLATTGCTPPPPGKANSGPSAPAAGQSPSGPSAKEELLAALRKTHAAAYTFKVQADLPDSKHGKASGAFDPKRVLYSVTTKESGGKDPDSGQRVVVGKDSFTRGDSNDEWVHLDLRRIKPTNTLESFDMKDPTGLAKFASSIESVERTGPNTFRGEFTAMQTGDPFVPIGTPSIIVFSFGTSDFTATTDGKGWVTSVAVELKDEKATLKMTTTLGSHGKPTGIAKPKHYGEAADFYYD